MDNEPRMKACVLHGIGDLRFEEVPIPAIGPDEVLLKIHAAGICGSDVPRVFSKGTYSFPTIPGHEFSGEVVRVNRGDEALLGGRYAVFPLLPCFSCEACAEQEYQQCADYDYYGSRRDGAFAEFLAVKKWNLVPVPDGVSYEEAAMTEPCAVALHALKRFVPAGGPAALTGQTVAIFGAGTIGLILAQASSAWGADEVILFDVDERKLDFARGLGFRHAVDTSAQDPSGYVRQVTGGRGADLCIEAAGVSATAEAALRCAARSGHVVFMGNPAGDMAFSQEGYWEILRGQLTIKGTWNSSYRGADSCGGIRNGDGAETGNDWTQALDAIRDGIFNLKPLITHRYDLQGCTKAFRTAADPHTFSVKVMFVSE